MKPKGRKKLVHDIKIFVKKLKKRAKEGEIIYSHDDYKCYKRIRALADLFPYENNERLEEINELIDELWILYYYYNTNVNGKKISYEATVIKYA